MLINIFIYIVVTLLSLFPFYFLCSHLFYSEKLYLNVLPFLLLGIFSVIHTDFIRSEELPFLHWHVDMGSSFFLVALQMSCAYSYCIPTYLAYRKYY